MGLHAALMEGGDMELRAARMEGAKTMMERAIDNMVLCEGNHCDDEMPQWRGWAANPMSRLPP